MERIFKGYPQALSALEAGSGEALMPYMVYRKEDQTAEAVSPARMRRNEAEYFKGLYPVKMKKCQSLVDEAGDILEYESSPMYDEFPDREFLYQVRDRIAGDMSKRGMEADRDLILVLLLNEISRRRMLK